MKNPIKYISRFTFYAFLSLLFCTLLSFLFLSITTTKISALTTNPQQGFYVGDDQTMWYSQKNNIVQASDGTLHVVLAVYNPSNGNNCGGTVKRGLLWFSSEDNGATWTCREQLTSESFLYASLYLDQNDNIHVTYSYQTTTTYGNSVYYRKISYADGSWSMGDQQTIIAGVTNVVGANLSVITGDTDRLWIALRYRDSADSGNYSTRVYNSDGFGDSPNWTLSTVLDTPTVNTGRHPSIFTFGSKIGVVYMKRLNGVNATAWRWRNNSDPIDTWAGTEEVIHETISGLDYKAVGDDSGRVHLIVGNSGSGSDIHYFNYNGEAWGDPVLIASAAFDFGDGAGLGITTNGTDVWVFYGTKTRTGTGNQGGGKATFRKGVAPFTLADFGPAQTVNSADGDFAKVYKYTAETYTDITTQIRAPRTNVDLITNTGDSLYFGGDDPYRAVWVNLQPSTGGGVVGVGGTVAWEYWNGSSWTALNYFSSTNPNFTGIDTRVQFIPPSDWSTTELDPIASPGELYYIRARVTSDYSTTPREVSGQNHTFMWRFKTLEKSTNLIPIIWVEGAPADTGDMIFQYNSIALNPPPNAPTITNFNGGEPTSDTSPTLEFSLSDPIAASRVKYHIQIDDTANFSSPVVDYTADLAAQGATSFTVGQAAGSGSYTAGNEGQTLSDGDYYWKIKAIDEEGAESSYTTANSGDVAFIIDSTAPTISSVSSSASAPEATIAYTTDEAGSTKVDYGLTNSYGSTTSETDTSPRVTNHSITISGLQACTTYHYRVRSIDASGNETVGSDNTFTTTGCSNPSSPSSNPDDKKEEDSNACNDKVGIQPPWLYSAIAQDTSSILLQFTEAAEPVEEYDLKYGTKSGEYTYHKENIDVESKSKIDFKVKDLSPNTTYYFRVRGVNGCAKGDWSNEISTTTKSLISLNNLQFTNSDLEVIPTDNVAPEQVEEQPSQSETETETPDDSIEKGYTVKIRVLNEQDMPVEGAKVTIHSKVQETTTDKDGFAVFHNVEEGDHRVIIAYDGYKGEQALNLTGDVKEFSLEIKVKQENVIFSPTYLWSVGILAGISITLFLATKEAKVKW